MASLTSLLGSIGTSLVSSVTSSLGNSLSALIVGGSKGYSNMKKAMFGTGLTDAQKQQNEWTASREDTAYQRATADMEAAGLNPALMYGSGNAAASSGSASADVGASLSDMLGSASTLAEIENMKDTRKIARENLEVDKRSAAVAEQNAATAEYKAETERMAVEQDIEESKSRISVNATEILLKQSNIKVNEENIKKLQAEVKNLDSEVSNREFHKVLDVLRYNLDVAQFDFIVQQYNEVGKQKALAEVGSLLANKALAEADALLKKREEKHYDKIEDFERDRIKLAQDKLNEVIREFDKNLGQQKAEYWSEFGKDIVFKAADIFVELKNPLGSAVKGVMNKDGNGHYETTDKQYHYDKYGRKSGETTTKHYMPYDNFD